MNRMVGMSPEQVRAKASILRTQLSVLESAANTVNAAALSSLNPLSYGIQPGGFVIAPFAIGGTQAAAAQVREARSSVLQLAQRLFDEAEQQEATSSGANSHYRSAAPALGNPESTIPSWLAAILVGLGIAGNVLDFLPDLERLTGAGGRFLVFARQQWVNGASRYARYRVGLLQWGSSTYKNNPVRMVLRAPQPIKLAIPTWALRGSKILGPVGTAITAITSGASAWDQQWNESSDLSDGERHLRAGAAAATVGGLSAAGAAGGAWAGAAAGAAIGSIFPGPGTAVGAVVGGIVGGIIGSGIGEKIGGWVNGLW